MDANVLPNGAWPVMVTPFQEDRSIDWAGVDALVEWYLAAGVVGLFAVAQTSDMYAMSPEERVALARRVVERVDGRVPVVASGTFGGTISQQIEAVRRMADTGVAAVVAISAQIAGAEEGDDVLRARLEQLLEEAEDVAFGLYECPLPYKRLVPTEMLGALATSGRFLFLKDTTERPHMIAEKVVAVHDTPLKVFNAEMSSLLETLRSAESAAWAADGSHSACSQDW